MEQLTTCVAWYFQIIEQNKTHIFKDILPQPDKHYFIMAMLKEVVSHETRNHWTLMKIS